MTTEDDANAQGQNPLDFLGAQAGRLQEQGRQMLAAGRVAGEAAATGQEMARLATNPLAVVTDPAGTLQQAGRTARHLASTVQHGAENAGNSFLQDSVAGAVSHAAHAVTDGLPGGASLGAAVDSAVHTVREAVHTLGLDRMVEQAARGLAQTGATASRVPPEGTSPPTGPSRTGQRQR